MRIGLILLLTAVCAAVVSAAPKKSKVEIPADVPKQFTGSEAVWLQSALSEEYLVERLKSISNDFSRGKNGRMLTVPECRMRSNELNRLASYYFLEADSGISKAWMRGNIKFTEALTQAQEKLNFLIMNQQTGSDEYRQWYDYYYKTAADFAKRVSKPVKINDKKRLAQQQRIKKAVLERIQAEEQAKQNGAPKLDDRKSGRK